MRSPEAPKAPKEGLSLRDVGRGLSAAQVLMRTEMEMADMVKAARAMPITVQPEQVGDIISRVLGPIIDKEVHEEALTIIREHYDPSITMSIPQWVYVTRMIELGIIAGRAGS